MNKMKRDHERLCVIKNFSYGTSRKPAVIEVRSLKCKGGVTDESQKIKVAPYINLDMLPLGKVVSIEMEEGYAVNVTYPRKQSTISK